MKNTQISSLAVIALFSSSFALAQTTETPENEITVTAQLRPRFEIRNGAYKPIEKGQDAAVLVNNRARVTMDYKYKSKLKLRLSAQNVNIWGQAAQVQVNDPSGGFSVFEAYGELAINENWSTKIGRQTIVLDDERIFGGLDWHPAGRSHDAINVSWDSDKAEVKSYVAYNQNYKNANLNINNPNGSFFNPTDAQPYQHMEMLHAKFKIAEGSTLSALAANLGFQTDQMVNQQIVSGKNYNMQTVGLNFNTKKPSWETALSGYYQFGKNSNGLDKSAYMLSGNFKYKPSQPSSVGLGIDYLSGDDVNNGAATKSNYFDPLYGTHHKFYGYMDYFYVSGPQNPGLLDIYVTGTYKFNPKADLYAAVHYFGSSGGVYAAGKKLSSSLGSEFDLQFNYQILPMVSLSTGYSMYFDTEAIRAIKKTPDPKNMQNWFWMSLNINPKIFSYKF